MIESIALLGFGSAIVVGVVYFAVRQTIPVVPFLYANARIQAKSKYLVKDTQWPALAESKSLSELTNNLRDTEYAEELDKVNDIYYYHISIEKSFSKSIEEIKEATPDSIDPLFDAYLMFWEAKMLKTFCRAFLTGQEFKENLVFPVGRITTQMITHLKEAETTADINVVLAGTPYQDIITKEHATLEELEVALDNFVFHYFVNQVKNTKIYEGNLVIDLLNFKFDIQNLLVLLKMEARNVPRDQREKYLIKNDTSLYTLRHHLIKTENIQEFVEQCSRLHYHEPLSEALALYEQDGSLSHFERVLQQYFKTTILKLERLHFQGPYSLFTHLVKKEIEMKNIMIISKGIQSKMSPEEIKELIL
ncbi:V-type ATPase subunit [archaeon]|nr:V-type ATPase subunit [archaeon]